MTPKEMERPGAERPRIPEMVVHPSLTEEEPSTSALWDWSDLLDFTMDDHFKLPIESDQIDLNPQPEPQQQEPPVVDNSGRVRKRDPRLTCSNFLAGLIPCACPELDEKLEAEEAALPGKKKARKLRAGQGQGQARCQVVGCEADISELKGYHKRHRVCLRCANARAVLIDGESKRYCQQCGKFHVLSVFDEGKRSCRRKLENHNNRRRRKSAVSKRALDSESPGAPHSEDIICDEDSGKDSLCLTSQTTDQEVFFESEDGLVSVLNSAPNSQNVNIDSRISVVSSGEIRLDGGKEDSKALISPSKCDNKRSYSSLCPTGRISFKLYDWNPAEFPRRLRHQIFQWLGSMPVELEGYIRPGCTILTVFIAMPKIMWVKLYEDPIRYLHDFVVAPGRMLSGCGPMFVYINNMIFHVKDGTSVIKVDVKVQAPRLHYVYPMCFEAGKPIELVACGSNLMQSKFRFLISFAGKYLPYDYCTVSPHGESEGEPLVLEHQCYKIYIPHTEPDLFGPAFIEVENEFGLSNFIPVIIGDKETCSEMNIIQERFEVSFFPKRSQFMASGLLSDTCKISAQRQKALSDLVVDIAWLLKVPASESCRQIVLSSQVQRFNRVFSFLIYNESTTILEKMLQNVKILLENIELNNAVNSISDRDLTMLLKYMDYAREILGEKHKKNEGSIQHTVNIVPKRIFSSENFFHCNLFSPSTNQDLVVISKDKLGLGMGSATVDRDEMVPFINTEVIMNVNLIKEWPRKSCGHIFSSRVLSSRPTIFVIAMAAVCFGVCVVVLHPQKVGHFATSIRRSLFHNS